MGYIGKLQRKKSKRFGEAFDTFLRIKEQMKEMLEEGTITKKAFDIQMAQIAEDLDL